MEDEKNYLVLRLPFYNIEIVRIEFLNRKTGNFEIATTNISTDKEKVLTLGEVLRSEREALREGTIEEDLRSLTDEGRMDIFRQFCTHCGSTDWRCRCWDDD